MKNYKFGNNRSNYRTKNSQVARNLRVMTEGRNLKRKGSPSLKEIIIAELPVIIGKRTGSLISFLLSIPIIIAILSKKVLECLLGYISLIDEKHRSVIGMSFLWFLVALPFLLVVLFKG